MPTANEQLFDRAVRHQVDVRRYTVGELRRMIAYLERMDRDTAALLRERLPKVGVPDGTPVNPNTGLTEAQRKRYQQLLADIRLLRQAAIQEMRGAFQEDMLELTKVEADFEQNLIQGAIPIAEITAAGVSAAQVRSVVFKQPFQGKLLKEWFDGLDREDAVRVKAAITDGFVQGQTNDQIVRSIIGTRASQYTDGVAGVTRRAAQAIVRTAINAYANGAREEVWKANEDIIIGLRWTSVLDGRTSAVCRGRDGMVTPIGGREVPAGVRKLVPAGARPPAHINCRSTMVPVLDWEEMAGNRPFVTDTRTRRQREIDFRAQAKEKAGKDKWRQLTEKQRRDLIRDERKAWSREAIGRVPAETTYGEWLSKQPTKFQNDVLGVKKAQLFRKGDLKLEQFTDRAGNELTLGQLKERYPDAFEEAGVAA